MPDFPIGRWPPLNTINPWSWESLGITTRSMGLQHQNLASTVSGTDIVRYYPFRLYEPATAVKLSHMNGATANGSIDLGIYDAAGSKIVSSGLQTQTGTNALQTQDTTDTLLQPGLYFMAHKCTGATGTMFMCTATSDETSLSVAPLYVETTGAGAALPTTWTPVSDTSATPLIGLMVVHFDTLV